MLFDSLDQGLHPLPAQGDRLQDGRSPVSRPGVQIEHHPQDSRSAIGSLQVGLVDGEDVGDLQDAGFDGLDVVAQAGGCDDDGGVGCLGDLHLRLARPHRLHEDHLEARRVQHLDRVAGGPGQPAQAAPAGHASDEDAGVAA